MSEKRTKHNHVTRDVKLPGECPACDELWTKRNKGYAPDTSENLKKRIHQLEELLKKSPHAKLHEQRKKLYELQRAVEYRNDRIAGLTAQLPEGMKHCTILFKQCEKGHGWLTAANWIQKPCLTCERDKLKDEIRTLTEKLEKTQIPNHYRNPRERRIMEAAKED